MRNKIKFYIFLSLVWLSMMFIPSTLSSMDQITSLEFSNNTSEKIVFNVKEFGAFGDGRVDDSNAFKKAILEAGKNKGVVFIPAGIYLIKEILIPESEIIVQGVGKQSILQFKHAAFSKSRRLLYGWHFTIQKNVVFKNFAMDGGANNFNSDPVDADGAHFLIYFNPKSDNAVENIIISECYFSGSFDSAIQSYGRSADPYPHFLTNNVKIDKCYFFDIGSHGVGMNEWRNSTVTNCSFQNMGKRKMINGYGSGMAVDVSAGSKNIIVSGNIVEESAAGFKAETNESIEGDIPSENVIFSNNIIKNCKSGPGFEVWYGIRINGKNITVRGNIIESNLHAILIAPKAANAIVEGNQILGTQHKSAAGIRIDLSYGNHLISGNQIQNVKAQGILVTSNSVMVTNNLVSNCQLDGIRIADVNDVICTQNIFKNNKGHGISVAPVNKEVNNVLIANNLIFDDREDGFRTQQRGIYISEKNTSNIKVLNNFSFNNTIAQEVKSVSAFRTEDFLKLSAPPKTGNWEVGDIIFNSTPNVNNFVGWVCIKSGSPGIWKAFGKIVP